MGAWGGAGRGAPGIWTLGTRPFPGTLPGVPVPSIPPSVQDCPLIATLFGLFIDGLHHYLETMAPAAGIQIQHMRQLRRNWSTLMIYV